MQLHWEHKYNIDLKGQKHHHLKIYTFSPKALFMVCTEYFNNAYRRYFEEVGGSWNTGIKLDDELVYDGWLFPLEDEIQKNLFDLLKKIHKGDIPPVINELNKREDMKVMCSKIFNDLDKIFELIPADENDSYSIFHPPSHGSSTATMGPTGRSTTSAGGPTGGGETIFYFNRDESERTKGNLIITLEKNRKKLEIYQYMY